MTGKSCVLKLLEQVFGLINHSEVKRALAGASLADVCFSRERAQDLVSNLGSFLSLDIFFTCERWARAGCEGNDTDSLHSSYIPEKENRRKTWLRLFCSISEAVPCKLGKSLLQEYMLYAN